MVRLFFHTNKPFPRTFLTALFLLALLSGCASNQPIKVGFTAELSGRNATLGVQGRNGALLAVNQINQRGGVNGRPLELLVRDDQASKETLQAADRELIDAGVVALSGHMTSWESVAARDLIAQRSAILFSPTTSSSEFTGQRDTFFRLIPANTMQAQPLASYAVQKLRLGRAALLHDTDNMAFAQTYMEAFVQQYSALGGEIVSEENFSSSDKPNFQLLVQKIQKPQPDLLLVIASSIDTALIAQQTRLLGWPVQIMTSNWAYTADLLRNGGSAVDGILISSHFFTGCQDPDFLAFQNQFQEAYGQPPAFVAVLAYETMQVLAHALQQTGGSAEGLGEQLTRVRNFKGLCDSISLDQYGDALRSVYVVTIRDGQFQLVETIPPQPIP